MNETPAEMLRNPRGRPVPSDHLLRQHASIQSLCTGQREDIRSLLQRAGKPETDAWSLGTAADSESCED